MTLCHFLLRHLQRQSRLHPWRLELLKLFGSKAQQVEDDQTVLRPRSFPILQCFYALLLLRQVWGLLLAWPPGSLTIKLNGLGGNSQGIRCRVA